MRNGLLSTGTALLLGTASAVAQSAQVSAPTPAPVAGYPAPVVVPPECPGACEPGCATDLLCQCGDGCRRPERFWVNAEYLMWWTQGRSLPPLVTTGLVIAAPGCAGAVGQPGARVLFDGALNDDHFGSGGRFTAGAWLDCCRTWGVEGSYFLLDDRSEGFFASSLGDPLLARRLADAVLGPSAEPVALRSAPAGGSGSIAAAQSIELQGFDVNVIRNLRRHGDRRVDLLAGVRYLDLRERMTVRESILMGAGATPLADSTITVLDDIRTENDFWGGQLGLRTEVGAGRLFARATSKVALGNTRQRVTVAGTTRIAPAGGAATVTPGGLLVRPTYIGRYERDEFSVATEGTAAVGVRVAGSLRAFVSYTLLYWNGVVRPGDVIDPVVNPAFAWRDSDFWAQGIGLGLDLRY